LSSGSLANVCRNHVSEDCLVNLLWLKLYIIKTILFRESYMRQWRIGDKGNYDVNEKSGKTKEITY
jgi:hypothetical protein